MADATSYDLPDGPTLVFLFNPFEDAAMESFIAHNLHHFRAHKSLIAYVNDRHRRSITKFGFETLYRDQALKLSVYRMAEPQG